MRAATLHVPHAGVAPVHGADDGEQRGLAGYRRTDKRDTKTALRII